MSFESFDRFLDEYADLLCLVCTAFIELMMICSLFFP